MGLLARGVAVGALKPRAPTAIAPTECVEVAEVTEGLAATQDSEVLRSREGVAVGGREREAVGPRPMVARVGETARGEAERTLRSLRREEEKEI